MLELTTLKVLVNRTLNEGKITKENYNQECADTEYLLEKCIEKIVKLFDEYYEIDVKCNFSISIDSNSSIEYENAKDYKYIVYTHKGCNLLLTNKLFYEGKYVDLHDENEIKNLHFSRGIVPGLIERTEKDFIIKSCLNIAKNINKIKYAMTNKLILKSQDMLEDVSLNLLEAQETNRILREFTNDVTVVSKDGKNEEAAE